jgi:small subunit ribosomal protein S20
LPSEKSARQSLKRYHRNRSVRRTTRTAVNKALASVESEDVAAAEPVVRYAMSVLDKAVRKGILNKNNASRRKSRLAARLNRLKQLSTVSPQP